MNWNIPDICKRFQLPATVISYETFGSGHIHDTFLIECDDKTNPRFLLQRINHNVFREVEKVMDNIARVTAHLQQKNPTAPGLQLVPTQTDGAYFADTDGNYWRIYYFIPNSRTYNSVSSPALAEHSGAAFGRFLCDLVDLPGPRLHDTIPHFHDMRYRLEQFELACEADSCNRKRDVRDEIRFINDHAEEMLNVQTMAEDGLIPERITHKDTKINNVLFDDQDRVMCVIDLDTVMPGIVHSDFGDAIRTAANTGDEDAIDLSTVSLNLDLFTGFAKGYLHETGQLLNATEIETLASAPAMMTFMQAIRFLTDYLNGDSYYKIHRPNHNLERTRAQLQLVRSMQSASKQMEKVLHQVLIGK